MNKKVYYHLGFGPDALEGKQPKIALISGDPLRAKRIAESHLKLIKKLSENRGLQFYLCETPGGVPVISATSGMGAPSMSIIVNELAQLGVKEMIRIGTTGAIQNSINISDVIISQASLCRQGAAVDIAPVEFPSSADPFLVMDLVRSAQSQKIPYHLGVTASVDTFYEGQERQDSANPNLLGRLQGLTDEYRKLGILNYEMESGTFFKMGLVYGFKAACVCGVIAQRTQSENVDLEKLKLAEERAILVAVHAISDNARTATGM